MNEAGKGDDTRPTDLDKFGENYNKINWNKRFGKSNHRTITTGVNCNCGGIHIIDQGGELPIVCSKCGSKIIRIEAK